MDRRMEKKARPSTRIANKNKAQGFRIIVRPRFCGLVILKKNDQKYSESLY